jgi:hypothetical protein
MTRMLPRCEYWESTKLVASSVKYGRKRCVEGYTMSCMVCRWSASTINRTIAFLAPVCVFFSMQPPRRSRLRLRAQLKPMWFSGWLGWPVPFGSSWRFGQQQPPRGCAWPLRLNPAVFGSFSPRPIRQANVGRAQTKSWNSP